MLNAMGVTHVIIGHSERRQYFDETDDTVNRKLKVALEAGLRPSSAWERSSKNVKPDSPKTFSGGNVCGLSTKCRLARKPPGATVAYEPVWAIGTGKTATPQMAADAHLIIRGEAADGFGQEFADKLRILYGGSVKPDNATALMTEEEIDGALVGGASLDAKSFSKIVRYQNLASEYSLAT